MEQGEQRQQEEIVEGFKQTSSSTIGSIMDSMHIQGIVPGLRALVPGVRIVGRAFTVKEVTGVLGTYGKADFPAGQIVDGVATGQVLVVDIGGRQVSTMGNLAALAMKVKGVQGMVVDGGVRDAEQIAEVGFPTYVRHTCAISGSGRIKVLGLNIPVQIGDVRVNPGDIVVADDTSVAIVPADKAAEVLMAALAIEARDAEMEKELRAGRSFSEVSAKYRGQ